MKLENTTVAGAAAPNASRSTPRVAASRSTMAPWQAQARRTRLGARTMRTSACSKNSASARVAASRVAPRRMRPPDRPGSLNRMTTIARLQAAKAAAATAPAPGTCPDHGTSHSAARSMTAQVEKSDVRLTMTPHRRPRRLRHPLLFEVPRDRGRTADARRRQDLIDEQLGEAQPEGRRTTQRMARDPETMRQILPCAP